MCVRNQKIPLTRVFIVRRLEDLLGLMVRSSYSARKVVKEKEKRIRKNPIAQWTLYAPRQCTNVAKIIGVLEPKVVADIMSPSGFEPTAVVL